MSNHVGSKQTNKKLRSGELPHMHSNILAVKKKTLQMSLTQHLSLSLRLASLEIKCIQLLATISLHSRLQLMCMERGDSQANRWVMCGLRMTYSRALREFVS